MGITRAQKTEAKIALVAAGLWRPFHRTRDRFKLQGHPPKEAYRLAFEMFFPNGLGAPPVLPPGCGEDAVEPGSIGDAEQSPNSLARAALGVHEEDFVAVDAPAVGPSLAPPPKQDAMGLIDSSALSGKSASRAEVVDWVARNIAIEKVTLEGCPSSEAWAMLRWVKRSVINEGEYWKTLYKALLPSRSEVDAAGRMSDDGRHVFSVIDKMTKIAEKEEADEHP